MSLGHPPRVIQILRAFGASSSSEGKDALSLQLEIIIRIAKIRESWEGSQRAAHSPDNSDPAVGFVFLFIDYGSEKEEFDLRD